MMGSDSGHLESTQSSRFLARWLIGGVVLGVSVLGFCVTWPQIPLSGKKKKKRPIRVYMDGCFDMMHYGHCNALRQARALGDQLIVGVVSDAEITLNKGPPVTPLHERMLMVSAVKWVDEVIPDAPYAITEEFMRKLFDEYNIDYIIHGDDPCILPDGTDAYALAKKAGRYKQIKRTEGVSSTDIVGRMLLCVRERSSSDSQSHSSLQRQFSHGHSQNYDDGATRSETRISHFLPTSRRIVQFSNGKGPRPDSRIVYIDGAFDLFHAGHVEILRLARGLGDFLFVGIHTDQTVSANRGAHRPIMNLHERSLSVLACRYVDEVIIGAPWEVSKDMVIPDAPYAITEEFMRKLFDEYNIDYIIHGDDPCILPDGTDAYALAKKAGRYKQIKRTEGVSSTDIVGRMLLCVRERSSSDSQSHSSLQRQFSHGHSQNYDDGATRSETRISHFLPTSRRIVQFSNGKGPRPDSRIVYIDGAFDLFHAGHVEILRLARGLGDFLFVGIHTDQTVSANRGAHRPIMNLHERSLSVLACRYVDEVIIGAPWEVSKDMITTFNISLVVHGTVAEDDDFQKENRNPYDVPIEMGIFKVLDSPLGITTSTIIRRIVSNHEAYQKRNERKAESEIRYYEDKSYVSGD